ncbi:hypothetical protein SDC9_09112 [bioreactor metagenome]|uniref:Uncharacterized protein n=1 Tax=bioreactor metagenome TaxID=1076179 RepID=A0A644T9L8_9ZZZZ|nr:hypothetical protein [Negativicutes bacterium]
MTKKKYGAVGFNAKTSPSRINQFVQKLPDDKRQTLHQELKSHGLIENPIKFTETHLEGGIEDKFESK